MGKKTCCLRDFGRKGEHRHPPTVSSLRGVLLPQQVASLLILQDGSFNSGIINLIKDVFLVEKSKRDNVDNCIISVLQEVQSDEQIETLLESIDPPQKGSFGERLINAATAQPHDQTVSVHDVRTCALASCLTWLRQGAISNCFLVGRLLECKTSSLSWYLEDLKDLIKQGYITRDYSSKGPLGKEIHLFGLECAIPTVLNRHMKGFFLHPDERAKKVFHIKAIQNACRLLGCENEQEFLKVVKLVLKERFPPTMKDILEKICLLNGASAEKLLQARFMIEATTQALLPQTWQNAISGIFLQKETVKKYLFYKTSEYLCMFSRTDEASVKKLKSMVSSTIERMFLQDPVHFSIVPSVAANIKYNSLVPFVERDGNPLPFYSLESFSDVLVQFETNLFKEFVKNPEFNTVLEPEFDISLLEMTFKQNASGKTIKDFGIFLNRVTRSELCYASIEETKINEATPFSAEGRLAQFDYGGSSTIDYFSSVEKAKEIWPTDLHMGEQTVEQWFDKLSKTIVELRKTYGNNPSFSVLTKVTSHILRLLPNHPTLSWIGTQDLKSRGEAIFAAATHPRWTLSVALSHIHTLSQAIPAINAEDTEAELRNLPVKEQYSINEILSCLRRTSFIPHFLNLFNVATDLSPFYLKATAILCESAQTPLPVLYFSDLNWEKKGKIIYGAMYFDLPTRIWKFAHITEDMEIDRLPATTEKIQIPNMFRMVPIESSSAKISKHTQRKEIVEFNRETLKKLQRLEQAFIHTWNSLDKLAQLTQEEAKQLFEGTQEAWKDDKILPFDESMKAASYLIPEVTHTQPETWRRALGLCHRLKLLHRSLIEHAVKKTEDFPVEYRILRPQYQHATGVLQYLDNQEAFDEAILAKMTKT